MSTTLFVVITVFGVLMAVAYVHDVIVNVNLLRFLKEARARQDDAALQGLAELRFPPRAEASA